MSQPEATSANAMIQMSVHSLPQPTKQAVQRTRMGRWKMLLVWAVCAAPVVASYLAFYVFKPQGRVNYGELIMPPVAMPGPSAMPLKDLDGHAVSNVSLKGQWLLVVVAGGACDKVCEAHLYLQRQLREVLGKDKDRLDRVWLVNDGEPVKPALLPGMKDAWVLRTEGSALAAWLKPEAGQAQNAHIYLVDPRGDWMMRFPVNADASRVKKDLLRLMKANQSWDEAGR
jgi:hypothetical protein